VNRFEAAEAAGLCECGQPIETHDPLPAPTPLRSWHALRSETADTLSRRAAAEANRANRVEPEVRRRATGDGLWGWRR
jgi:hypothetical protein